MSDVPSPLTDLTVRLPDVGDAVLDQDSEWCIVETDEGSRRIRFHEYGEIYAVPGLYERLFYEELHCCSPTTVRRLLELTLDEREFDASDLTVLDVGAGNGMVAAELDDLGAGAIVGVDILEEAAAAAERDRPGLYEDYRVVDLTDPAPADDAALRAIDFNCLTTVAALGFDDIPPEAFSQALEYVSPGGLVAFTLRDRFTTSSDQSGFGELVRDLHEDGTLAPISEHRYRHRISMAGDPLHYIAYVSEKTVAGPVPLH